MDHERTITRGDQRPAQPSESLDTASNLPCFWRGKSGKLRRLRSGCLWATDTFRAFKHLRTREMFSFSSPSVVGDRIIMTCMCLPSFSLKQVFLSVFWFSIGFGAIAFSFRDWPLSLHPSNDWLAEFLPVVQVVARVLGWALVCAGLIPLDSTQRRAKALILALCGGIPGAIIAAILMSAISPSGRGPAPITRATHAAIMLLGVAIGSIASLAVGARFAHGETEQARNNGSP